MGFPAEFDQWAVDGKDLGMAERHWHTAKHAISRLPLEEGDRVLDLGTGSGYMLRQLRETYATGQSIGVDASIEMIRNARQYTDDLFLHFLGAVFSQLPLRSNSFDCVWSMEAFYYAQDPRGVLEEIRRILKPGGVFFCAVNFFEESESTHAWQDNLEVEMTLWSREEYRQAFREAGLHVAAQETIPDEDITIPAEEEFPIDGWESRDAMVDRYRRWGTLLTIGVAP